MRGRYQSGGALWYAQGHIVSVTFVTHHMLTSIGITPQVAPFLGQKVYKVADAMIELASPGESREMLGVRPRSGSLQPSCLGPDTNV